eukprot:6473334-Amphidinium_carterae.1
MSRQDCKPKAKRQAKRPGKAPQKQKGGAQPALPPGTLSRGRTKGPNKKPRLLEPAKQAASLVLSDLQSLVEREYGENLGDSSLATAASSRADGGPVSPRTQRGEDPQVLSTGSSQVRDPAQTASSSSTAVAPQPRRRQR